MIEQSKKDRYKWFRSLSTADLTPYTCPGLDDIVKQGMELEAKGYKMRPELVHEDDKYFIIFERNGKEMSNEQN